MCVCVSVCMGTQAYVPHVCRCPQRPKESTGFPITGGSEGPNMGPGYQVWVCWISSKYCKLLILLFSYFFVEVHNVWSLSSYSFLLFMEDVDDVP